MSSQQPSPLTGEQIQQVTERFVESLSLTESTTPFERFKISEGVLNTVTSLSPFIAEVVRESVLAEVAHALSDADPDAQAIVSSMRITD